MTRPATYVALNSRIAHGGRSVDREPYHERQLSRLPVEKARAGLLAFVLGRK